MMRYSFFRSKKAIALAAAVLGAAVMAAIGLAGIWTTTVSQDIGNVRLRVVQNVAGNFDSGWHYHPGILIVNVKKGTVAFTTAGSCTTKTYTAGDSFIEDPYIAGHAVALGDFEWTATYVIGYGDPLSVPVTGNPCP